MKNKTSIVFTGDIGFDRYMDKKWEDEHLLSLDILKFLNSADHVCANVEGALIDAADDGSRGVFFHSMNPKAIAVLKKMKADVWSIGNNHTMDAGRDGVASTISLAKKFGARTVGAGIDISEASAPLYIDEAGGIGIICVSYMNECIPATESSAGIFRWDDMQLISQKIREIKEKHRWCIVISHGGEEFAAMPLPYTRDRYIKYLEMGADAVVGHHPHVPENYETFEDGKVIFYSLGNFIFDTDYQRAHLYTDTGILLKLVFTEDKLNFEAIGIITERALERIGIAPLPDIFTDIREEDYSLLSPLNAREFLLEVKKTMIYLDPDRFKDANEEKWTEFFQSSEPDGYYERAHMDLNIVSRLADNAKHGLHEKCSLERVKSYILAQNEKE